MNRFITDFIYFAHRVFRFQVFPQGAGRYGNSRRETRLFIGFMFHSFNIQRAAPGPVLQNPLLEILVAGSVDPVL